MFFLYSLLLTAGVLALLPLFAVDALRHGKYVANLRERAGRVPKPDARGRPILWLHCVSVGETQAARPLVEELLRRFPAYALVVSTTTLTGQRVAREAFGARAAAVIYFPFDWAWSVRRALSTVNPAVVLTMETELWPRFLLECRRRNIPVALVNGRVSEGSFSRYKKIGRFIRRVVNLLRLAVMQTEADAERMVALGLVPERVKVSGNIKFDADISADNGEVGAALRERFGLSYARPLVVAASTHAPEEALIIEAFKRTLAASEARRPRLLTAPRHPERFAEVATLLEASGLVWARRSANAAVGDADCDVILLDTIGELRAVYPLAELVFVGGSLAPVGGHNVLEPAAFARCVITGPHTSNFDAVVRAFLAQDALVQLHALQNGHAPEALAGEMRKLLEDDSRRNSIGRRALAAFEQNRGATARTLELLAPLLNERSGATGRGPNV